MRPADLRSLPAGPPQSRIATSEAALMAWRLRIIRGLVLALLLGLVAGLGYWQMIRSDEVVAIGRRQILRHQIVPAPRGSIYDRERRVLAENRPQVAAVLDLGALRAEINREYVNLQRQRETQRPKPAGVASGETTRARLAVVQRHQDHINAISGRQVLLDALAFERHFASDRTAPFVLLNELNPDEIARLVGALPASGPVRLQRSLRRTYPNGSVAAHVIGRIRRERTRHPGGSDFPTLNVMDGVGDSGLEKQHDAWLQGRPGEAIVRLDAAGFVVGPPLDFHEPSPGQDLVTSIDLDLQLVAERAMAAIPGVPRGAAVALAVATGEILVMASKPDFDLNAVSPRISAATKHRIDSEGGWLNRATQALYPPGSSFKIYTAIAGLRHGALDPKTAFVCPGHLAFAGHRFVCHVPAGHGEVTLRSGLEQSCNVFAYQVGLAVGPDALAAEARRFHFGEPAGIDLPFETRSMLVPDSAWKAAENRGAWTTGDTINLSIGQGFIRFSPLQAACAMASLARRETLTVPTLLRDPGRSPSGDRPAEMLGLKDRDYAALVEGLRAVVESGIGLNAQVPGVSVAGKSGTAQVMRESGMMNVAWFVAFAPVERPEIAIAVAMEGDKPGEEFAGAAHAAPIVSEIAVAYFKKQARK
jgi:penicillin-binding protein 2